VMPVLRARGVAASDYEGESLRERLVGTESPILRTDHPGASHRQLQ